MATNPAIDDALILQALKLAGHKTKKEAVNTALREYIAHKKQAGIIDMFGAVEFDETYDHKKARKR